MKAVMAPDFFAEQQPLTLPELQAMVRTREDDPDGFGDLTHLELRNPSADGIEGAADETGG
jgi:hypothetical protein